MQKNPHTKKKIINAFLKAYILLKCWLSLFIPIAPFSNWRVIISHNISLL